MSSCVQFVSFRVVDAHVAHVVFGVLFLHWNSFKIDKDRRNWKRIEGGGLILYWRVALARVRGGLQRRGIARLWRVPWGCFTALEPSPGVRLDTVLVGCWLWRVPRVE